MNDLPYIDKDKFNIIDVIRIKKSYKFSCSGTIGQMYINDVLFCSTLEPYDFNFNHDTPVSEIKLTKSMALNKPITSMRYCAIPTGVYDIDLHGYRSSLKKYIPKEYNNCCPLIKDVPGFSGVMIHVGNLPKDTSGCILVGDFDFKFKQFRLINSTESFHKLLKKLWSFKYPIKLRISRVY